VQGFVVFVKEGKVKQNVKVKVEQVGNRFATATLVICDLSYTTIRLATEVWLMKCLRNFFYFESSIRILSPIAHFRSSILKDRKNTK
jgi:hypothetical protein